MTRTSFVRIGRVARPHGLKGEVSIVLTTELGLEEIVGTQLWFLPPGADVRSARLASVRPGPKGPLATLEGIDSADAAGLLRGKDVAVAAADLPDGYEDIGFDPVGMSVTDESRGDLGEIVDVIATGANDVWVVDGPLGEILLPVIDDVILSVDEDASIVSVRLLDGLVGE